MDEGTSFDLHAAFMRRAQTDMKAFLEAFAVRMEQSLPGQVEIHRKKDSLFASTQHVSSINIRVGGSRYVLENAHGGLQLTRCNEVRGIVLKTEEMQLPDWLTALNQDLMAASKNLANAHGVLHDFLMG